MSSVDVGMSSSVDDDDSGAKRARLGRASRRWPQRGVYSAVPLQRPLSGACSTSPSTSTCPPRMLAGSIIRLLVSASSHVELRLRDTRYTPY